MADSFLTHDMIAERALFDLKNNLVMAKPGNVYMGYDSELQDSPAGYKKGNSVRIRKPNKYRTQSGPGITHVDIVESNTTITVDTHNVVPLDFLISDLTYSIDRVSERFINPAMIPIANGVDLDGLSEYKNLYNFVGTLGTTPATLQVLADAKEILTNEAVPQSPRVCVMSPKAIAAMSTGEMKALFSQMITEKIVKTGFQGGPWQGFMVFEDQNVQTHTNGTAISLGTLSGTADEGATTLAVTGGTANGTITAGTVITVGSVYGVNPVSGAVFEGNQLRKFVVTANVTLNGSGANTLAVSPKIYSEGADTKYLPYQTVNGIPTSGAAVSLVSATASAEARAQNLAFHPNCFALTVVPFAKPESAFQWATATDPDLGLSVAIASDFDITNYKEITRMDILYGWDTIYAELGCRITG